MVIVNLHLSHLGQGRPAEAELQTTVAFAEELASW